MKKAKEIDFTMLDGIKSGIKQRYNFIKDHDKFGLFIVVNIALYGIGVLLFMLRAVELI